MPRAAAWPRPGAGDTPRQACRTGSLGCFNPTASESELTESSPVPSHWQVIVTVSGRARLGLVSHNRAMVSESYSESPTRSRTVRVGPAAAAPDSESGSVPPGAAGAEAL